MADETDPLRMGGPVNRGPGVEFDPAKATTTMTSGAVGAAGATGPAGPKGATSIFGVISFVNNNASLKASDRAAIRNAGIKNDATITVAGYTSKAGSSSLNQRLSKKRADSIAKEIRTLLPNVKIRTVGLGEKVNKACAKLQNRCVVISVTQSANS